MFTLKKCQKVMLNIKVKKLEKKMITTEKSIKVYWETLSNQKGVCGLGD